MKDFEISFEPTTPDSLKQKGKVNWISLQEAIDLNSKSPKKSSLLLVLPGTITVTNLKKICVIYYMLHIYEYAGMKRCVCVYILIQFLSQI